MNLMDEPFQARALAYQILHRLKQADARPGQNLALGHLQQTVEDTAGELGAALEYLVSTGFLGRRFSDAFVLTDNVKYLPDDPPNASMVAVQHTISRIAQERNAGLLSDAVSFSQLQDVIDAPSGRLRAAMRCLMELGLVQSDTATRWRFHPSIGSHRSMDEAYAARRLIEPQLFTMRSFDLDRRWLKEIKARHLAFQLRPWRSDMITEYFEMNLDFHEGLALCSNNFAAITTIHQLNKLRSLLIISCEFPERPFDSTEEHIAIIEALESDNFDLAAELMTLHLTSSAAASVNQKLSA